MWTRRELKDKAKISFNGNYWKSVLVALLLLALSAGFGGFGSISSSPAAYHNYSFDSTTETIEAPGVYHDIDEALEDLDDIGEEHVNAPHGHQHDKAQGSHSESDAPSFVPGAASVVGMFVVGLMVLILIALAVAIAAFILNPLEVGSQRFFLRNLNQKAEVKEVAYAYDNNYMETVKTLFLRDIFIILWSLLLIVPGIVKSYEYRMIPFLLAEDPTMTKDRAFSESKRMMTGQKWNAFVLDLSFLGWNVLSVFTLGILAVFYVAPYQCLTNAALYEKLRYGLPSPEQQAFQAVPPYGNAGASAQQAPFPTIVPTSQPPVAPFAAVGATQQWAGENATDLVSDQGFADMAPAAGHVADAGAAVGAEVADAAGAAEAAGEANGPAENAVAPDSSQA